MSAAGTSGRRRITSGTPGLYEIPLISLKIYVNQARAGDYDTVDTRYYNCSPKVTDLMEIFLQAHFDEFIEIV